MELWSDVSFNMYSSGNSQLLMMYFSPSKFSIYFSASFWRMALYSATDWLLSILKTVTISSLFLLIENFLFIFLYNQPFTLPLRIKIKRKIILYSFLYTITSPLKFVPCTNISHTTPHNIRNTTTPKTFKTISSSSFTSTYHIANQISNLTTTAVMTHLANHVPRSKNGHPSFLRCDRHLQSLVKFREDVWGRVGASQDRSSHSQSSMVQKCDPNLLR